MSLLGPAEIRGLADLLGVQPTKKLGQNFVIDANTVRRIVKAAGIVSGQSVVEVGPGLGSLTLGLLETGASVVAVEIDNRLATQLSVTVELFQPGAPLTVITQDAMTITELPGHPTSLVANLPYNISVPVVLSFLEAFPTLRRALVMVQLEVAERLAAPPGSRTYGIPSLQTGLVMVQAEVGQRIAADPGSKIYGSPSIKAAWYGKWRTAGQISRQVFWPVPNVDSILVRFDRGELPGTEAERVATFALVDAAFQQRRKMLRQSLSGVLGDSAAASARLDTAGVAPTARGEELTVADFLAIARAGA